MYIIKTIWKKEGKGTGRIKLYQTKINKEMIEKKHPLIKFLIFITYHYHQPTLIINQYFHFFKTLPHFPPIPISSRTTLLNLFSTSLIPILASFFFLSLSSICFFSSSPHLFFPSLFLFFSSSSLLPTSSLSLAQIAACSSKRVLIL